VERSAVSTDGEQQLGQWNAGERSAGAEDDRRIERAWSGDVSHRCGLVSRRGRLVSRSVKFPHGLAAIADEAHRQGLHFGIWTDWTQAALDTQEGAINVRDPKVRDWLVTDLKPDWKPEEFKGQTIDIGLPAAHDWAAKEVKRIVEDYHLDMLEHDGYLVAQGCTRDDHPHAAPNRSTMQVIHDWVRTLCSRQIQPT